MNEPFGRGGDYNWYMERIKIKSGIIAGALLMLTALTAAACDYDTIARKAQRFFDWREWASAQALYGIMIDSHPDADSIYVKDIVASSLLGQEEYASKLLTDAMKAGVSFSRLMAGVKDVSFAISEPAVYERFLERSKRDCPWLARAIDDELLSYYMFRDNGEQTVIYARKMLDGLPESIKYLSALAQGYACCGNFDNATDTWKRILTLDPDHYETLLRIGNYYAIADNKSAAIDYLTRANNLRSTPYLTSRLTELSE